MSSFSFYRMVSPIMNLFNETHHSYEKGTTHLSGVVKY